MHLTPYITDVFGSIKIVISAAKGEVDKVDGIHAGLGLADYGAITFGDPNPTPVKMKSSSKTESMLAADLEAAVAPHAALHSGAKAASFDWSSLWTTVEPIIAELLKRWLG